MEGIRDLRNSYLDCLIYFGIMLTCIFNYWDKLELKQLKKKIAYFFSVGADLEAPRKGRDVFFKLIIYRICKFVFIL